MLIKVIILLGIASVALCQTYRPPPSDRSNYQKNVIFRCWRNASNPTAFNATFGTSLESQGCPKTSAFSVLIHGWMETPATTWIYPMVTNILNVSKGCVCSVDYSAYSGNDYFDMVHHDYLPLANLTLQFVKHIGNYSRMHMFGFSFGGRIAIKVGSDLNSTIETVDVCESAQPAFQGHETILRNIPSTKAGKNVRCINTSSGYGTTVYDCHQNFRMGNCGWYQPAHGGYPMGSHGLCPHFYNSAFTRNFTVNGAATRWGCTSPRLAPIKTAACAGARMGYTAVFNTTACRGDFFIDTASTAPYWMA